MNISFSNIQSYNNKSAKQPSFQAIHPTLFYLKVGENSYQQVTDPELVKSLQKKITTWLNHDYNIRLKELKGLPQKTKPETPETKAIRERITRFFVNRDQDFRYPNHDRALSYFNTHMTTGSLRSYLFTGKSAEVLDICAEKIKDVQSQIKRLTSDLEHFYGFKYSDAKERASKELEQELMLAKSNYHKRVLEVLSSPEEKANPVNTVFTAFFEPVTKGKKTSYNLINAEFEPRLV